MTRSPHPAVPGATTESVTVPTGDHLTRWAFENPTPVEFRRGETGFLVRATAGVRVGVAGDRIPMFGSPLTLRLYCADDASLLGHAYGARHSETLYLAGLGSDVEDHATTGYRIQLLLGAAVAWARAEPSLTQLGLLRPEDDHADVVRRVYRELPERLGTRTRWVFVGQDRHRYEVTTLTEAALCLATASFEL